MSHSRNNDALRRTTWIVAAIATAIVGTGAGRVQAVGLNYVDASIFNLTPGSAINLSGAGTASDNVWGSRTDFGANITVFESGGSAEDSPEIVQRVSGLTPGVNYDFYTVLWSDKDENWGLRTGLTSGVLTPYTYSTDQGNFPYAGATKAITAGAAVWDSPPPPGLDGTVFTQRPGADPLIMLLGKAGSKVANASGEVDVYVDDLPALPAGSQRSWLDGVAYVASGTTVALTATIDRNTGAVTVTNPTSTPFQIKSYSINSVAGSLNGPQWSKITGQRDGAGNSSFDSDLWSVTAPADPATTPFATVLSEAEVAPNSGVGGTLAANGGTLNFGNIWTKSRFQDVRIELTLADDTLVAMYPDYTGPRITAAADFNGDGTVSAADYQTLMTNIHTDISTLTQVETSRRGDMNGDRVLNFTDFSAFGVAFDDANGVGAFAQMVAQVPEPAAASMLLVAGLLVLKQVRGRRRGAVLAVTLCGALAGSAQAQTLLSVDFDDRETVVTGTEAGNTVAGFEQFILTGTNAAVATATTRTLAGYDVTVTPVNAAGVLTSGVDDRDRTTPTTAPTLNQIYDDFIFTAGGVGVGGGLDVTVQGGTLQPNKPYLFSLYAFDTGSAGVNRTADWLDGNRGDLRSFATTFIGSTSPTTDNQYRFTGVALTDAAGRLFMRGRNTSAPTGTGGINPGVFMNGLQIEEFTGLTLEVNSTTGAIRLLNEQSAPIDLSYYEIRSGSGALNPAGWTSLDDGEGGDPIGVGWDEAVASNANILSEGNLTSQLSVAANGGASSLGAGYVLGGAQDITFSYAAAGDATLRGGYVKFVTGGGGSNADYNDDLVVDGADFLLWQRQFGTSVPAGTGADGSGNGQVDAADLTLWKNQFGTTLSTAAAAAVPEPVGCSLAAMALAGLALGARRRK